MPTLIRFSDVRLSKDAPPDGKTDFARLFDAVPEPLAYIGPERRLEACNRRFRELFPALVEERLLQSLLPEGGGALVCGNLRLRPRARALADGGMLVSFAEAGQTEAMEQEYRALEQKLRGAQAALDDAQAKAERRKNALVATGHELRTPLNAILGFAGMMEKEMLGPLGHERYREYAGVIGESGRYLLEMVNDLLDLARLDAGKTDLKLGRVEVLGVIVDCVKTMEPLAVKARVGMSVRVYDGVSQVVGDATRLRQMLLNLLSNAIKFTMGGGEICIEVFRRDIYVAIAVSDSGSGMNAADMKRVMEPFERADTRAHPAGGTGLGLPLTRELAELHGGALTMESTSGVGTTITILLPGEGPGVGAAPLELRAVPA